MSVSDGGKREPPMLEGVPPIKEDGHHTSGGMTAPGLFPAHHSHGQTDPQTSGEQVPCKSYKDDPCDPGTIPLTSFTTSGSFPKDFDYGSDELAGDCPSDHSRILLMGLRGSGKSSIQKVMFHKVPAIETTYLEGTTEIIKNKVSHSAFVQLQVWDVPGEMDVLNALNFDCGKMFNGCGALIFVIDSAQDDYYQALDCLHNTVAQAHAVNPKIKFEVFIHKVDTLSESSQSDRQRDISLRTFQDLKEAGLDSVLFSFHLTTIYDHSIFEAFSKVVQKLIPQLPTLENLLNLLISNSGMEKAFLFDMMSKICIATDSSPVDMCCYELCCDMIDTVIEVSSVYGSQEGFDGSCCSSIRLNTSMVLHMTEVNPNLALVCVLREQCLEKRGIIDYNVACFKKALRQVFEARKTGRGKSSTMAVVTVTHKFPLHNGHSHT